MKRAIICLLTTFIVANMSFSQQSYSPVQSPYNAQTIFELARQVYTKPNASPSEYMQGFILLNAAYELDRNADYIVPEIINVCLLDSTRDYSENLLVALKQYVNENTDLIDPLKAIRYLLEKQKSREEKEAVLSLMLQSVASRNGFLLSELAAEYGLLLAEKADFENAAMMFQRAYSANPYNSLAFWKLVELNSENIKVSDYLVHYRMMMQLNPYDISYVLQFAQNANKCGLYQTAFNAYSLAKELFIQANGNTPLPSDIYIPMSMAALNSKGEETNCLKIAAEIRNKGSFDIVIEAIAYKAALKLSDNKLADEILDKIDNKISQGNNDFAEIAWYNSLIRQDYQQALAWANKAYSQDPNSAKVLEIFALSLAQNGQTEIANQYLKDLQDSQIVLIAKALVSTNDEDAVKLLKNAITVNPASPGAEYANNLLNERKSTFIFETEPATLLNQLNTVFGNNLVPKLQEPQDLISFDINVEGNEFLFSNTIKASIIITNKSKSEIVIHPFGLIKGQFAVSAKLTGDLNSELPNFFIKTIRPSSPIKPGSTISIPIDLSTGPIDEILCGYPQAEFKIKFTAYLDPVVAADGSMSNAISSLPAGSAEINRKATQLSSKYIQQRLTALNNGQQGQKIRSIKLFAGLLKEKQTVNNFGKTIYRMFDIPEDLLVSALQKALREQDWTVRLQNLYEMRYLLLNKELTMTISELLNDDYWHIRMLAIKMLADNNPEGFGNVLNWMAINDKSKIVQNFAVSLGAKVQEE